MIKRYSFTAVFISLLAFLLHSTSCNLINPPVNVPCYGHVDTMHVTTVAGQGSASSNITCAWVYLDDNPVGAFELPSTFPMIAGNGSHLIKIFPGITADGLSATRAKYPFYTYYSQMVNLTQGSTVKFSYTPTYTSSAKFDWIEDFESGNSIAKLNGDTSMFVVHSPTAFEGSGSGEVVLDSNSNYNKTIFTGVSANSYYLPTDGSSVFMEINYNTNNTFSIGVCSGGSTVNIQPALLEIFPSTGWSKMYIDLGPAVARQPNPFYIYFFMQRQPGIAQAVLLLDNIKIVQFK